MMRALILALLALALSGCTRTEPLALHGAGSMRVEVEVYKGPLTEPLDGQVGQLVALVSDSIYALDNWRAEARNLQDAYGCDRMVRKDSLTAEQAGKYASDGAQLNGRNRDCLVLNAAILSSEDLIGSACYMINTPTLEGTVGKGVYLPIGTCQKYKDNWSFGDRKFPNHVVSDKTYYEQLKANLVSCGNGVATTNSREEVYSILHCQGSIITLALNNLSSAMRTAAFRLTDTNVRSVPQDKEVRGVITAFGFIASEYGNQLQARITVLQRQFNSGNTPGDPPSLDAARRLPVSDYLRDAGRTDFIQLFDWLKATPDEAGSPLDPRYRIRMAQRLTADYYWQKVNEVYASGQGEVAMAFVKDDLGNWDLKSFSNDPSELLASYRKVTDAALNAAISLTKRAATGGIGDAGKRLGLAARATLLANQVAGGETPAGSGDSPFDVTALHDRAATRIAALRTRYQEKKTALDSDIVAQTTIVTDAEKLQPGLKTAVQTATDNLSESPGDAALQAAADKAKADLDANLKTIADAEVAQKSSEKLRDALPKEATAAIGDILDDHLAVIAAMQDSIGAKLTKTQPPVAEDSK